jgi:phosphatidyl-myo-inositol alpha-mannosyltransferase
MQHSSTRHRYPHHPHAHQDLTIAPATNVVPAILPQKALRIAIVTEYYYPHIGGICEHVHYFAREARLSGHQVDIITSNIPGATADPNVIRIGRSRTIFSNGSTARFSIGWNLRRRMREVLRAGDYDIVHVHSPIDPTLPLLAVDEAEAPLVGTFHTYFDRVLAYQVGAPYFRSRIRRLDAPIAVSPSAVEALERYFHADWRIVPNGVDTAEFSPHQPCPPEMDRDVPTILYLGRLDPRNGLRHLLGAFRILRRRGVQARLVVVGGGPQYNYYRKLAAGEPDIVFTGRIDGSRAAYYANATIYAAPTTHGASFGITLLEAMACETPVVCSYIAGFRDVVRHEREALMVPRQDEPAMARALERLLEDETLRARMGKAGRETALRYDWTNVTGEVLGVYASVLARRSAQ